MELMHAHQGWHEMIGAEEYHDAPFGCFSQSTMTLKQMSLQRQRQPF
jgi:hypothetical protein